MFGTDTLYALEDKMFHSGLQVAPFHEVPPPTSQKLLLTISQGQLKLETLHFSDTSSAY